METEKKRAEQQVQCSVRMQYELKMESEDRRSRQYEYGEPDAVQNREPSPAHFFCRVMRNEQGGDSRRCMHPMLKESYVTSSPGQPTSRSLYVGRFEFHGVVQVQNTRALQLYVGSRTFESWRKTCFSSCEMKSACSSRGAALLELPFAAVFIHDCLQKSSTRFDDRSATKIWKGLEGNQAGAGDSRREVAL